MNCGERVLIPVAAVEFVVGGNTIWVHSPKGATVLRIQTPSGTTVTVNKSCDNCVSHADIRANGAIEVCLSDDINSESP